MKILAIETSCDETAAAIVANGQKVLTNQVASSQELHKKTGGIVPEVAARQQLQCLIPVLETSLEEAFPKKSYESALKELDALAVTYGPGLIGSLLVGVEAAKTLSYITNLPLIPVNHLHGHIFANWLEEKPPTLPAVSLIASGGHTQLVRIEKNKKFHFELFGNTRDDAAGECFDKCARTLGMSYPGGPAIAAAAAKAENHNQFNLPRPMIHQNNFDFSFSGLKTAVINTARQAKKEKIWHKKTKNNLAWEIQAAICDVLVTKTLKAARANNTKTILLGGGVCANQRLRQQLKEKGEEFDLRIPPIKFCTDNAAIIGAAAFFIGQPTPWRQVNATPNLNL